jgi:hypothetical protein
VLAGTQRYAIRLPTSSSKFRPGTPHYDRVSEAAAAARPSGPPPPAPQLRPLGQPSPSAARGARPATWPPAPPQVHQRLLAVTRPLHVACALSEAGVAAPAPPPPPGCLSAWVKPLQHTRFVLATQVRAELLRPAAGAHSYVPCAPPPCRVGSQRSSGRPAADAAGVAAGAAGAADEPGPCGGS